MRRRRPAATSLHPHSHPRPSVTALADGPPRRSERAAVNDAWKANLTHMMLSPHARRNMAKAAVILMKGDVFTRTSVFRVHSLVIVKKIPPMALFTPFYG